MNCHSFFKANTPFSCKSKAFSAKSHRKVKALDDVFLKAFCGPTAELGAAVSSDPVTYGQDHVQILEIHRTSDFPLTLDLNYPEFPDSWLGSLFPVRKDVLDVLVDHPHILLEQVRHQLLAQPHGFVLKPHFNTCLSIFCLVKQNVAIRSFW